MCFRLRRNVQRLFFNNLEEVVLIRNLQIILQVSKTTWVVIVSTGLFASQHSCGPDLLMGHAVCVKRLAQTRIISVTCLWWRRAIEGLML